MIRKSRCWISQRLSTPHYLFDRRPYCGFPLRSRFLFCVYSLFSCRLVSHSRIPTFQSSQFCMGHSSPLYTTIFPSSSPFFLVCISPAQPVMAFLSYQKTAFSASSPSSFFAYAIYQAFPDGYPICLFFSWVLTLGRFLTTYKVHVRMYL